ncbi:MAG: hypothetical protein ACRDIY_01810 [Chloroflexota bacterium]
MSYCPKCHHEYAESVERCIDCGRALKKGRRPPDFEWDFEDLVLPVGSFFCALVALGMLYLRVGAQAGWLNGTLAHLVMIGQPPLMTAFYVVAAIASSLVFSIWLVLRIFKRD